MNDDLKKRWDGAWALHSDYRRSGIALTVFIGTFSLSESYWLYQLLKGATDQGSRTLSHAFKIGKTRILYAHSYS